MSFASALSVLRPTLPSYLALTKYSLLRLTQHSFEFHPHPAAPPIALEMAKAVFTLGASSCIESYATSRMLAEGPKVFCFDALTCEAQCQRNGFFVSCTLAPGYTRRAGNLNPES
jgi:hypothetical protein